MNAKPYYTTDDVIEAIKLTISFPLSQNTFTYNDIVKFINQELLLNAVPTLIEEHEEYLTFKSPLVPLVDGISRYPIPNRAIGMALRDLLWSDSSGNFFKMSRIAPEDKAYFQRNVGSNQAIGKYYLEGNEIVLTPQIQSGATGNLNFIIFLRPNQLVRNDRAAIIQSFQKSITVANNTISVGDEMIITIGNQTPSPTIYTFTAVTGSPVGNEFLIGTTASDTAQNLYNAISNAGIDGVTTSFTSPTITLNYDDITTSFVSTNSSSSFSFDADNVYIKFDQLPSTYTDPDTNETTSLYTVGGKVDFLQTDPGHRTFTYDIKLRQILPGNVGKFKKTDLQNFLNNSSGGQLSYYNIQIGDYICLQNECIIPQIPPELHHALAERAASRILMALGDQQGLAISQAKIAEMNSKQETLIGSRVEGSVNKVFNSFSLLRVGKRSSRRRI